MPPSQPSTLIPHIISLSLILLPRAPPVTAAHSFATLPSSRKSASLLTPTTSSFPLPTIRPAAIIPGHARGYLNLEALSRTIITLALCAGVVALLLVAMAGLGWGVDVGFREMGWGLGGRRKRVRFVE
ncbi:hypothetical protein G7Y79_00018g044210 [Physcia stellaris]|nr:hypothetical protein G7Y79_00018g044210 [Physcia stellaris]